MPDLTGLFDTYARRARLYPALLTLSPPVAATFAWVPSLVEGRSLAAMVGAAASFGLLYALASISRSAGKRTEQRLLAKWGGWPTTIMLRHGCADIPAPTKARYHQFLAQCGSWDGLPSAQLEQSDPAANDDAYESAVQWLKEQRRGPEFRLVLNENAEYGFRRNMRGLKPWALALCLVTLLGWLLYGFTQLRTARRSLSSADVGELLGLPSPLAWGALGVTVVAFVAWILVVKDRWVREAADQYAQTLLATCDATVAS
jgi:hypothetical protein